MNIEEENYRISQHKCLWIMIRFVSSYQIKGFVGVYACVAVKGMNVPDGAKCFKGLAI